MALCVQLRATVCVLLHLDPLDLVDVFSALVALFLRISRPLVPLVQTNTRTRFGARYASPRLQHGGTSHRSHLYDHHRPRGSELGEPRAAAHTSTPGRPVSAPGSAQRPAGVTPESSSRLGRVHGELAAARRRIDDLEAEVVESRAEMAAAERRAAEAARRVGELESRVERIVQLDGV